MTVIILNNVDCNSKHCFSRVLCFLLYLHCIPLVISPKVLFNIKITQSAWLLTHVPPHK